MAQWINVLRNNSFKIRHDYLCYVKKIGAVALVQLDLTAGRQAGRLAGRQNAATFRNY